MTQEKLRRIVSACVAAATALLVFLLGVLIYQWISLAVLDGRIARLDEENKQLQQKIDEGILDAEYFESDWGKEWLAFEYGFITGDN